MPDTTASVNRELYDARAKRRAKRIDGMRLILQSSLRDDKVQLEVKAVGKEIEAINQALSGDRTYLGITDKVQWRSVMVLYIFYRVRAARCRCHQKFHTLKISWVYKRGTMYACFDNRYRCLIHCSTKPPVTDWPVCYTCSSALIKHCLYPKAYLSQSMPAPKFYAVVCVV